MIKSRKSPSSQAKDKGEMLSTDYNEVLLHADKSDPQTPSSTEGAKKIVIVATGSRGEVQPFIAVALALKSKGHDVVIATEARTKGLVEEFNLECKIVYGDSTGALFEPSAQKILKGLIFELDMMHIYSWSRWFHHETD